jgi:carboxyl-terminal processing protease
VVTSRKLSETTTYIKIYRFHGDFDQQLAEALHQITDSAKTKVIIDLRNNLGGETDLAISVADKFIPNGIIVEEKLKNKNEDIVHKASGGAAFKNIKVIVLTNTETASGAEILAAAIKDNHRGTLVGEKTYGKGTTGQFFGLPDGSAVHLTVGKWYRANGETIQGRGVIPDVEVEDALMNGEDQILKKAMEL